MARKKDNKLNDQEAVREISDDPVTKEDKGTSGNSEIKENEQVEEMKIEDRFAELQDKYLRLSAEFDNYRKRTLKEKMELIKTAGEDILVNILPVVDDFERAMKSMNNATELSSVKEGVELIYNKFIEYLRQHGVKAIESDSKELNTDIHEAVTKIPAPSADLKAKIVDTIQKGYYLNEKVIRYAKVVVGE